MDGCMNRLFTDLKQKDMLIDNTNDKVASEEEKAIWKILDDYKLNAMLQPNCADEIIELVNKLFIQRVSQQRELLKAFKKNHIHNFGNTPITINELEEYIDSL